MHRFILHNDEIHEASEKLLAPGQTGLCTGWGVFTTIKVIDGVLFAFARHWARMSRDAALMRVPMPADPAAVEESLLKLVDANRAASASMRVYVVRNHGGMFQGPGITRPCDVIAMTAEMKDWGDSVRLEYFPHGRHAGSPFAGAKVLAWGMNLTILEGAQARGFDEAILLNERGEVAECTSANIFAARGSEVWTPPLSAGCLPGITRELLLGDVRVDGVQVSERTLLPGDLETADEVFISSTTRDLLPVREIGMRKIPNSGHARARLQRAFSAYVDEYVRRHSRSPVR